MDSFQEPSRWSRLKKEKDDDDVGEDSRRRRTRGRRKRREGVPNWGLGRLSTSLLAGSSAVVRAADWTWSGRLWGHAPVVQSTSDQHGGVTHEVLRSLSLVCGPLGS
ncbi:hypothetical protein FGSG_13101 [Fusarium graminearum PH-1]|uniref:hypothetical protein n=1 Tax=Gibberella zeae (strain ATCC MYA-4620 / CBS 123657 / FGSC 9075 / NRRL 31084 / PH-1) TaxID=229533 RepID=UPI00021F1D08|nr:hypothetical protein FGSG_13101 [Fusarium graminearum PH-1]ESU13457.1 hypothetical protein FGSG_13101 [Fusarium graminearum PH-1]EYB26648.1 hypothetical protein FG05_13101 [Fusarium graminearum]|eukprot:XP_011326964.1 hypothetical protein FGSG_13101 [Fusarium graminearum PH-1]